MQIAAPVVLFSVIFSNSLSNAAELQRHEYLGAGFSAEFSGIVREIELNPTDRTRGYIAKTAIYEEHGDGYSFSITVREYRYGMPDLIKIAQIIQSRVRCSANVTGPSTQGLSVMLHGEQCLPNRSILDASLIGHGRWLYQAVAIVAVEREMEGLHFVRSLQLKSIKRENVFVNRSKLGTTRSELKTKKMNLARIEKIKPQIGNKRHFAHSSKTTVRWRAAALVRRGSRNSERKAAIKRAGPDNQASNGTTSLQ